LIRIKGPAASPATVDRMKTIQSATELYAHAIAIEREAAARYGELAQHMGDRGNEALAEVFATL